MNWAMQEFETLSLGDKRLNKRGQMLLKKLSNNPSDSIPTTCVSASETKAAYRFFDNEQVTHEKFMLLIMNLPLQELASIQ